MKKTKPVDISNKPFLAWLEADRSNRRKLRDAGYSQGRITNYKTRGIPRAEVGQIAAIMGIPYEQYMEEAGASLKGGEQTHSDNAFRLDGGRRAADNDKVLQFVIATYRYADPEGQEEIEETANIVAGRKRKSAGGNGTTSSLPASESRPQRVSKTARLSTRRKRG